MAATQKSRGAGTVFMVILVLLAIAGGSAWLIHTILSGKDIPVPGFGQGEPSGTEPGQPSVAQGGASTERPLSLPGGVMVQSIPGGMGDGGSEPSATVTEPVPLPPVIPDAPLDDDGPDSGETEGAENLLLVPGAIEQPAPSAREDAVVRPAFVDNVAAFLAQNYWPKGTHQAARNGGMTTVSLRWANLRYGAELRGLDGRRGDTRQARRAVLEYVLNPATVNRLYGIYADPFVAALVREAGERTLDQKGTSRFLTPDEKKEMFAVYASFASRVAAALERYAANPAIAAKVDALSLAEAMVEDANKIYLESVIAYENSLDQEDRSVTNAARLIRDKDAATYQKRIREREAAHRELVAAMSPEGKVAQGGNDTLVYVAFWAHRRGEGSAAALRACAKALTDIGAKLTVAARQF